MLATSSGLSPACLKAVSWLTQRWANPGRVSALPYQLSDPARLWAGRLHQHHPALFVTSASRGPPRSLEYPME